MRRQRKYCPADGRVEQLLHPLQLSKDVSVQQRTIENSAITPCVLGMNLKNNRQGEHTSLFLFLL